MFDFPRPGLRFFPCAEGIALLRPAFTADLNLKLRRAFFADACHPALSIAEVRQECAKKDFWHSSREAPIFQAIEAIGVLMVGVG